MKNLMRLLRTKADCNSSELPQDRHARSISADKNNKPDSTRRNDVDADRSSSLFHHDGEEGKVDIVPPPRSWTEEEKVKEENESLIAGASTYGDGERISWKMEKQLLASIVTSVSSLLRKSGRAIDTTDSDDSAGGMIARLGTDEEELTRRRRRSKRQC